MAGAAVLVTKIEPPALRTGHVPRARLVERLRAGDDRRLTLVIAPAGSGKSTLLAEWRAATAADAAFAWLALDPADNDPARFWAHVIAALRQAGVAVPDAVGGALTAPGARASDAALPQLVNALAASGTPVVLAIDDYHLVQEQEVHDGVGFLLVHR
jgi:ATP/maltotriose-dependent transcriptional regulator MalT